MVPRQCVKLRAVAFHEHLLNDLLSQCNGLNQSGQLYAQILVNTTIDIICMYKFNDFVGLLYSVVTIWFITQEKPARWMGAAERTLFISIRQMALIKFTVTKIAIYAFIRDLCFLLTG